MTPDPTSRTLEQQVATLTATVDQLQAERDRDAYALKFLLVASAALAAIMILQHRQLIKALP